MYSFNFSTILPSIILLSIFVGLVAGIFLIGGGSNDEAIRKCEENLKRNETCVMVAVPAIKAPD